MNKGLQPLVRMLWGKLFSRKSNFCLGTVLKSFRQAQFKRPEWERNLRVPKAWMVKRNAFPTPLSKNFEHLRNFLTKIPQGNFYMMLRQIDPLKPRCARFLSPLIRGTKERSDEGGFYLRKDYIHCSERQNLSEQNGSDTGAGY